MELVMNSTFLSCAVLLSFDCVPDRENFLLFDELRLVLMLILSSIAIYKRVKSSGQIIKFRRILFSSRS